MKNVDINDLDLDLDVTAATDFGDEEKVPFKHTIRQFHHPSCNRPCVCIGNMDQFAAPSGEGVGDDGEVETGSSLPEILSLAQFGELMNKANHHVLMLDVAYDPTDAELVKIEDALLFMKLKEQKRKSSLRAEKRRRAGRRH